jgi:peroxiredoxin
MRLSGGLIVKFSRSRAMPVVFRVSTTVAHVLLVVLLAASLGFSPGHAGMPVDPGKLPASAEDINPLRAGDTAPTFTVRTVDNEAFLFDPATLERPVIFISFRGGWCPYCNLHLAELRNVIPEIRGLGVDVYFLSGDRPELLNASLARETQDEIAGLDYIILSDADLQAAKAFGTAFRVGARTLQWLNDNGKDIGGSSIDQFDALPVPAVYVIDSSGKIAFDYVNPDYKIRLPAGELLAVARRVASQ